MIKINCFFLNRVISGFQRVIVSLDGIQFQKREFTSIVLQYICLKTRSS